MKYYFKSKSKKYLLATILLLSLCPLLGLTYSSFIFSSDNYRASEMYIGSLMYGIKINDESVSKIIVAPGETEVNIQITSLNTVSSFYKLIYKENSNILVEYNEDNDLPSGNISNKKEITIKVTNSSSSNIEVEFDIASGYITNTIENVIIPQGYTEVTGVYVTNDISIIAIYVDGVLTNSLDSEQNYELDNYTCTNNETVSWDNDSKALTVTPLTESTECTVYFKVKNNPTLYEKIIADNPTIKDDNADLFANAADEESESGLFRTTDLTKTEGGKEVLYFRGVVENNYLVFAGYCWRIIRTNESGNSIKLRYGGEPTTSGDNYVCPQTGTDVKITVNNISTHSFSYNAQYNDSKYVKWVHEDGMDSNAKTQVETWYTNEIETQGEAITNLIIDEPYCNDTSVGSTSGSTTYYGAYTRLYTNKSPQFKCPNASDKYTVDATKGNGKLSKPVALLTADEVAFAGGFILDNTSYYLYTSVSYWIISPSRWTGSGAFSSYVNSSGALNDFYVTNGYGLLPAVSLKAGIIVNAEGDGTYTNPYVVES